MPHKRKRIDTRQRQAKLKPYSTTADHIAIPAEELEFFFALLAERLTQTLSINEAAVEKAFLEICREQEANLRQLRKKSPKRNWK
jgi:polyphosphate kinase 2 (PPK2 family)